MTTGWVLPCSFACSGSVENCRQFLKEIDGLYSGRHPLLRDTARDFALRRWLELDAESALAEAERVQSCGIPRTLTEVQHQIRPTIQ